MGQNASALELSDDDRTEIKSKLKSVIDPLSAKMLETVKFYIVKKYHKIRNMRESTLPCLPKGRISIPLPEYKGWADKEGGAIKTWKKRYMVLKADLELVYYATEEDYGVDKKKGTFYLTGYQLVESLN